MLTSSCAPAIDRGKAFVIGAKLASAELVQGDVEEWADAPPPNGARPIRAQFIRGDDGSVGFHRWVLETGRTECTFSKQPFDETVRCYPVAPAPVNAATFADSACTQLIAEVGNARTACTGETTQIAALVHRATEACSYLPTGTEWFTVNPGTVTSFFQKNPTGECVAYPVAFSQAHAVGTPLPVETFGAPRVETPMEGKAFSSLHVQLADGTRGRHGFYDGTRNVGCTLERAADLSFRCIPEGSQAVRGFFTDAACTVLKLVVRVVSSERSAVDQCQDKGDCDAGASLTCAAPPKPAYARQTSYPGCTYDQITRAYSVGEPVAQYYEIDRMGACVSHVVGTGEGVYELTEIPPAELPGAVQSHP